MRKNVLTLARYCPFSVAATAMHSFTKVLHFNCSCCFAAATAPHAFCNDVRNVSCRFRSRSVNRPTSRAHVLSNLKVRKKSVSVDHTRHCIQTKKIKIKKIHVRVNATVQVIRACTFTVLPVLDVPQRVPPTCTIKTNFTYLIKLNIEKSEHLIVLVMSVKHTRKR
jgi:hypothetical protein